MGMNFVCRQSLCSQGIFHRWSRILCAMSTFTTTRFQSMQLRLFHALLWFMVSTVDISPLIVALFHFTLSWPRTRAHVDELCSNRFLAAPLSLSRQTAFSTASRLQALGVLFIDIASTRTNFSILRLKRNSGQSKPRLLGPSDRSAVYSLF